MTHTVKPCACYYCPRTIDTDKLPVISVIPWMIWLGWLMTYVAYLSVSTRWI